MDTQARCVCITCSDRGQAAKVIALLDNYRAAVEIDGTIEEISVELCDAAPGDTLLVHAGVALAVLGVQRAEFSAEQSNGGK